MTLEIHQRHNWEYENVWESYKKRSEDQEGDSGSSWNNMSMQILKRSSSRKRVGGMLIVLLLYAIQSGCNRDDATQPGVTMQLTPSKKEYRLNERIALAVNLTNRGDKPCRIIPAPEITVHILTFSRDGIQLLPNYAGRTHFDAVEDFVLNNLVSLEPAASKSLSWVAERWTPTGFVLPAASLHSKTTMMRWPVDKSGAYTLVARQVMPESMQLPSDICPMSIAPVTTHFTVTGE